MYKLMNLETNKEINKAYIDGYQFGDRLLEGVIFEVTVNKTGKDVNIKCVDGADYFNDLNTKKWIKEAKKAALWNEGESLSFDKSCRYAGEVVLRDISKPPMKKPTPIIIEANSGDDLLDFINEQFNGKKK